MKKTLKGSLLVAAPKLQDPNFERSVVLLAEHSKEGGFGLILNRPSLTKVASIWQRLSGESLSTDACVYVGGPVEPSSVFLLHTCEDLAAGSIPVVPGVYLGNEEHLFQALVEREGELRRQGKKDEIYRVFCGYSGWGEGQLDTELKTGSWLIEPANAQVVFATPVDQIWPRSMERRGGLYRIFAQMPRNPEHN